MLIDIELSSDRPIYRQIADGIRAALVDARLGPGDRLPPGRELAEALDVNLDTVQRAYRLLVDEGLVVSRVGRGTRIVDSVDRPSLDLRRQIDALIDKAATIGVSPKHLAAMVVEVGRASK